MVEKEHVLKLLKQNQSFVVFGKEFVFAFTWDEKRGMYEEYREYKKCGWEKGDDIMQVFFEGRAFESYLEEGEILVHEVDGKIENEIVANYIRKDYQERSRYLLTSKKRNKFAALIQDNKKALNMDRAEKLESCYNLRPQLPEEWRKKEIGKREGYLLTVFFHVNTYKGKMESLLEFL
ncbi:hypothetical protein D3Z44_10010 [Lachnospiraceae bacterium]|nr:hypothetical protein [Lachnospiraceae bacterium]